MKIAITGATGFVGSCLTNTLLDGGHNIRALVRRRAYGLPGVDQIYEWDSAQGEPPPESLEGVDAVIHLAGGTVARRCTPDVNKMIDTSRVDGTRQLVNAL